MSTLDLRGPDFLQVFLTLSLLLIAAGLVFRWLMTGPFDDLPSYRPDLDPLEVAYLAGGPKSATDAAIASLVHADVLGVRGSTPPGLWVVDRPTDDISPLETAVYESVASNKQRTIREVRKSNADRAAQLAARPEEHQFVLDPMRRTISHVVPIIAMTALLALGMTKVFIGWSRNRPVGFLVGLCIVVAIALFAFAASVPHRTRRGSRFLKRLKRENVALQATAMSAPSRLACDDLALAFGLYGATVLASGPLADLGTAMKPPSSGGSGCSGGSSGCGGGGCGGGGCGGCGGGD